MGMQSKRKVMERAFFFIPQIEFKGGTLPGVAMTRAFASLNPQEALHVAIFIEERNAEIYQRFAEMFTEFRDAESREIASVFWDMSVEEKRHSTVLQGRYQELFGSSSCAVTEEDLREMIEVPKLESGDVFEAAEVAKTTPRERAIQVALQAEKTAHDFYAELVKQTADEALRRLYLELSAMEDGHVTYLQSMLSTPASSGGERGVQ
jgi:rubrerythrin